MRSKASRRKRGDGYGEGEMKEDAGFEEVPPDGSPAWKNAGMLQAMANLGCDLLFFLSCASCLCVGAALPLCDSAGLPCDTKLK